MGALPAGITIAAADRHREQPARAVLQRVRRHRSTRRSPSTRTSSSTRSARGAKAAARARPTDVRDELAGPPRSAARHHAPAHDPRRAGRRPRRRRRRGRRPASASGRATRLDAARQGAARQGLRARPTRPAGCPSAPDQLARVRGTPVAVVRRADGNGHRGRPPKAAPQGPEPAQADPRPDAPASSAASPTSASSPPASSPIRGGNAFLYTFTRTKAQTAQSIALVRVGAARTTRSTASPAPAIRAPRRKSRRSSARSGPKGPAPSVRCN